MNKKEIIERIIKIDGLSYIKKMTCSTTHAPQIDFILKEYVIHTFLYGVTDTQLNEEVKKRMLELREIGYLTF